MFSQLTLCSQFSLNPCANYSYTLPYIYHTGSTIFHCGVAVKNAGAASVSAFVAHAVFPNLSWRSYLPDGPFFGCFEKFFVTNSVPSVTDTLPHNSVFEVLDMSRKIVEDLDRSY